MGQVMNEDRPWHFLGGFLLDDQYLSEYLSNLSLRALASDDDEKLYQAFCQLLPEHPMELSPLQGEAKHQVVAVIGEMTAWWEDEKSRLAFLRGYAVRNIRFEVDLTGDYCLRLQLRGSEPCVRLGKLLRNTYSFVPSRIDERRLEIYGVNALTLAGKLYEHQGMVNQGLRSLFYRTCQQDPGIHSEGRFFKRHRFIRMRKDAVAPVKSDVSDSGYDMVLLEKVKEKGAMSLYDTGIQVIPAPGYYFDLVPRSSIIKSGYMLSNSVGIIDRSYRGNVMAALTKIDPEAEELILPNRMVQLIPRRIDHHPFVEVSEGEQTFRGAGGFGSTGNVQ